MPSEGRDPDNDTKHAQRCSIKEELNQGGSRNSSSSLGNNNNNNNRNNDEELPRNNQEISRDYYRRLLRQQGFENNVIDQLLAVASGREGVVNMAKGVALPTPSTASSSSTNNESKAASIKSSGLTNLPNSGNNPGTNSGDLYNAMGQPPPPPPFSSTASNNINNNVLQSLSSGTNKFALDMMNFQQNPLLLQSRNPFEGLQGMGSAAGSGNPSIKRESPGLGPEDASRTLKKLRAESSQASSSANLNSRASRTSSKSSEENDDEEDDSDLAITSASSLNHHNNAAPGTAPGSSFQIHFCNADAWKPSYVRTRHKNLRCFPACLARHMENGFCGQSVCAHIFMNPKSLVDELGLELHAGIRKVSAPLVYEAGRPVSTIYKDDPTSQNKMFRGEWKSYDSTTGRWLVEFIAERRWRYLCKLAKHTMRQEHVFTIYIISRKSMMCVAHANSPSFRLTSAWKQPGAPTPAAAAAAAAASGSSSLSGASSPGATTSAHDMSHLHSSPNLSTQSLEARLAASLCNNPAALSAFAQNGNLPNLLLEMQRQMEANTSSVASSSSAPSASPYLQALNAKAAMGGSSGMPFLPSLQQQQQQQQQQQSVGLGSAFSSVGNSSSGRDGSSLGVGNLNNNPSSWLRNFQQEMASLQGMPRETAAMASAAAAASGMNSGMNFPQTYAGMRSSNLSSYRASSEPSNNSSPSIAPQRMDFLSELAAASSAQGGRSNSFLASGGDQQAAALHAAALAARLGQTPNMWQRQGGNSDREALLAAMMQQQQHSRSSSFANQLPLQQQHSAFSRQQQGGDQQISPESIAMFLQSPLLRNMTQQPQQSQKQNNNASAE